MMFFFGFGHNKNIVEVDGYGSECDEVFKDVIHHLLKSGR